MSAPTTPPSPTRRRPRRGTLLIGLLVVAVLAVTAGWLVHRSGSSADHAAATDTPLPPAGSYGDSVLPPSNAADHAQAPDSVVATVPGVPQALTPVGLGQPATYSDGVTAQVVDIKAVSAHAQLPGETSGPALAVIIKLTNATGQAVSLDTVAVNLYLGSEGLRAARIQADSGAPFSGTLAAGGSAQAVYAFRVPEDQRNPVTVTVGHSPDTGRAVFTGAVS